MMSIVRRLQHRTSESDSGFTVIELMMAMVVMAIVMTSLTLVLVNSLVDTAYNRQRTQALTLANQAIEEVRALGWATVQQGLSASDLAGDSNIANNCFEDQPLDVGGVIGAQSGCVPKAWTDPSCLTGSGSALPTAGTLLSPVPLTPHQVCYNVNGRTYGLDVYVTGGSGNPAIPPLTLTVVVSWAHPVRGGLADHVVTTTQLSSCLTVGTKCT